MSNPKLPSNFSEYLNIPNAEERLSEAKRVGDRIAAAGVPLLDAPDHAAIFADPPYILAGPLKQIGYVNGWDARCYPSPVDGEDYINVSSRLPDGHSALSEGWFRYVAVVHPVDQAALNQMLSQGYGNPFLHHLTWGIVPPNRETGQEEIDYAGTIVTFMVEARQKIYEAIGDEPGTLIAALPPEVIDHADLDARKHGWFKGLTDEEYQVEAMEGGGYLLQFFVLSGGRIEVALRVDTKQTFNPKSVHKISEDEISTVQH